MKSVSVVIPSWNTLDLLRASIAALERSTLVPQAIVVVDNASTDGSADMVAREFPRAVLIRNERNEGFTRAVNQGLERTQGELVLCLNADTELASDALGLLAAFLEAHPEYAAAAPRLVNPDGTTARACMRFPRQRTAFFFGTPMERWFPESRELERYFMRGFDHESDRDVEQPPAACLLLRRSVLEEIGVLDERLWLYFSDVDLSLRMHRAGYKSRYLASARVVHHCGASTRLFPERLATWHSDRLQYYRKHFGRACGLWAKLCTTFAFLGFAGEQLARRIHARAGQPSEPIRPLARALGRFLRQ